MNEQIARYQEKINALSMRERALVLLSAVALLIFLWWNFYAQSLVAEIDGIKETNEALERDISTLQITTASIDKQIRQGVHQTKQEQLKSLTVELDRLNDVLNNKALELIDPDKMFQLMQELIFAESKLKLNTLKRKQVKAIFDEEEKDVNQPEVFRHVMEISFQGKYQDILSYIDKMQDIEWKLIWDKISLKTDDYPMINVNIQISTLSRDKYWVGL